MRELSALSAPHPHLKTVTHVVKPPLTGSNLTGGISNASTTEKCASILISEGSMSSASSLP